MLDHYLARTNFRAQQTEQPVASDRPDNLWHPVDAKRDYGAHGAFDDRAMGGSVQWWLRTHLGTVAAIGAGTAGLAGLAVRGRGRGR